MGEIHSLPFAGPRAASPEIKIGHAWMRDFNSPSTQASPCKDDRGPEETHGKDFPGYMGNGVQRAAANNHILSSKMYLEL